MIEAAGGRYVEAAVMSPIAPRRLGSPLLLGGPHARQFLPLAQALGFSGVDGLCRRRSAAASAAKMCRCVIVKGLEALLAESLLTARRHGVEAAVLASLQDLFPVGDWDELARYMISRSVQHGRRRAEEMAEAVAHGGRGGRGALMAVPLRRAPATGPPPTRGPDRAALTELLDAVLAGTPPQKS